jgi:hypothetical protein
MNRFPGYGAILVSGLLLGACSHLIGLSDYEEVSGDDDAGEDGGGRGGSGGNGGTGNGGSGATTSGSDAGGNAGSDSAGKGGMAGKGGSSSTAGQGSSGEGGEAGEGGSGGSAGGGEGGQAGEGGAAGSPSGGTAGMGGSPCTEITSITYVTHELTVDPPYPDKMVFHYAPTPALGTAGDTIDFEFYSGGAYNGEATGSFNLAAGDDGNYETCARCVYAESDSGARRYFQESGTMIIDTASRHMSGAADFSIVDVTLVEVTIAPDLHSTPVPNGRCLHIANADIVVQPPAPEGWTCPDADYSDALCDCGCGIVDPVCETSYAGACDYCGGADACTADQDCIGINPADNAVCTGGPAWKDECYETWYGDGDCDCGCGSVDVDCVDALGASCLFCWCVNTDGSCAEGNGVNPKDNGVCL